VYLILWCRGPFVTILYKKMKYYPMYANLVPRANDGSGYEIVCMPKAAGQIFLRVFAACFTLFISQLLFRYVLLHAHCGEETSNICRLLKIILDTI
jgi:hypothetical protein